jgi:hypothetical protein
MPKQTKEQTMQSLLHFISDFDILSRDKFNTECKLDQSCGGFVHDGKYYLNFQKHIWGNGFTEYYIERYSKNIFDPNVCKTKKEQNQAIREWAFIYPKGMNKTNGVDKGVIIGDWSVSHYSFKKGG